MSKKKGTGTTKKEEFLTPDEIRDPSGKPGVIDPNDKDAMRALEESIGLEGIDYLFGYSDIAKKQSNEMAAIQLELIYKGRMNFGDKATKADLYIATLEGVVHASVLPDPDSVPRLIKDLTALNKEAKQVKKQNKPEAISKPKIDKLEKNINNLVATFLKEQMGVNISGQSLK